MEANMVLIRIDECGDEVEVSRFTIGDDLDDDYIELWKDTKIEKAREQYPEAQGFYFEDRRAWNTMIARELHGDWDPWEDEDYDEDEEWEDECDVDDYSQNTPCDNYGFCGGMTCPIYFECKGH